MELLGGDDLEKSADGHLARRQARPRARYAGGSGIITSVVHTVLNVVDYGMTIQEAVDTSRFHQQWLPETTAVERFALSPDTMKILVDMGHTFSENLPPSHLAAILVGAPCLGGKPRGADHVYGANDSRRDTGLATGY